MIPVSQDAAVQVLSQQIADAMGEFIERRPEQWVMPGGLVSDSLGRRGPGLSSV